MGKVIIEYDGKAYEVVFYDMLPMDEKEIEAKLYKALRNFHEDFSILNRRIFEIKALINEHICDIGHVPEHLRKALEK
jgi:hypothetical protein